MSTGQQTLNVKFSGVHIVSQLFRERLAEKCARDNPAGNMGYDQYTVPDTVAVEPTFVAFL